MKKIFTLITVFAMSSSAFGQSSIIKKAPLATKKTVSVINRNISNNNFSENSNTRSVIWTDDFSVPANWTKASPTGPGLWTIGTAGPQGGFLITNINSTTKANGFALFDSDVDCSSNQVANITTANPINCSANPSVILKFQQQYRRYYDSTFVFISNNGTSWVKYPVNSNLSNNDYCAGNPEVVKINITPTAGGQATVYVRFQFYSPTSMGSSAGCGYSWMIDDVSIEDQLSNDLELGAVFYGEYSRIPDGQQVPITFGAAITNIGAAAQTNVTLDVTVNSNLFNASFTNVNTMAVGQIDTAVIQTQFTPGAIGNYVIAFAATQTETDGDPSNNVSQNDTVKVTANTFARDNYNYKGDYVWNGGDPFEIGNIFTFADNTNAISVNFVLDNNTLPGSIVAVKLYDTSLVTVLASSNPYTILGSNIPSSFGYNPKSVTIPFTSTAALVAGESYVAAVEFLNASGTDTVLIATGTDIVQPSQTSFIFDTPTNTWFLAPATPMVRLNVALNVGISELNNMSGIKLSQNVPNPFNKTSTINYEIEKGATVALSIYDVTGKKVLEQNEGNQNAGKHNINFNAQNLSAGVYYYSLTAGKNTTSVMKMVVIK